MLIKEGTLLKNNDPRVEGTAAAVIRVLKVDREYAYYHTGQRHAKIRLDRIYPAGSTRKQGYSVHEVYA